jgi:hypothetical protein
MFKPVDTNSLSLPGTVMPADINFDQQQSNARDTNLSGDGACFVQQRIIQDDHPILFLNDLKFFFQ